MDPRPRRGAIDRRRQRVDPAGSRCHRGKLHDGELLVARDRCGVRADRHRRDGPRIATPRVIDGTPRLPPGPEVATIRPMTTSRRLLVVLAGASVFILSFVDRRHRPDAGRSVDDPHREHGRLGVQHGPAADGPRRRRRALPGRHVHAVRAAVREGRGEPSGWSAPIACVPVRRFRAGTSTSRRRLPSSWRRPRCRSRSERRLPLRLLPPRPRAAPVAAAAPAAPAAAAPTTPPEAAAPRRHRGRASPPRAPAAPAERVEVTLDQAVFDEKLAELLEKGTDRRVAEGQARRAAMIAARKKAEGG